MLNPYAVVFELVLVALFGIRLLLQLSLTWLTHNAAALHTYAHLIMGLALLVLTTCYFLLHLAHTV